MGFESAYRSSVRPPWDIDEPQPAVVRLAGASEIRGPVLDAGCGTGENALVLASHGFDVTGLDAAPTAIERASRKAADRDLHARFVVGDALELGRLRPFGTVIDCGLFHTFDDDERSLYERAVHSCLRRDGRFFLLCFSDREPGGWGPRRVSEAEIRQVFAAGWRIDSIQAAQFATSDGPWDTAGPHAWLASMTRL